MSSECPTCGRDLGDEIQPLTTVSLSLRVKVAPGAVIYRSHVVDLVQEALLSWMHSDTYTALEPTDEAEDVLDVVIAR